MGAFIVAVITFLMLGGVALCDDIIALPVPADRVEIPMEALEPLPPEPVTLAVTLQAVEVDARVVLPAGERKRKVLLADIKPQVAKTPQRIVGVDGGKRVGDWLVFRPKKGERLVLVNDPFIFSNGLTGKNELILDGDKGEFAAFFC